MKKLVFLIAVIAMVSCGTKTQKQTLVQDSICIDTVSVCDTVIYDTIKVDASKLY